jgi:prepilin-type processing-associated H-X9-DG protein
LLGSQAGAVMALPMAAAVILPATYRARAVGAQRAGADNNLRQIGVAIQMYVVNHQQYPTDFAPLLAEKLVTIDTFVSPHAGTQIPPDVRNGKIEDQTAWVNSRSDFVYLGADLKPNAGPGAILVYERPDGRPGMNILFGDGHIEWIDVEAARQMIEKQQKVAAK